MKNSPTEVKKKETEERKRQEELEKQKRNETYQLLGGSQNDRLAQLTGIAQSSLGRIVANESTPSLQTLEKICSALDVTLSQFFQNEKENHLTDKQNEVMEIWNDLSADEQAVVLAMLRGLKK